MPQAVTARFDSEEEAESALSRLTSDVALLDSAVVTEGLAGSLTLDSLELSPEERASCEQQLSKGGFLLVAKVSSPNLAESVLAALERIRHEPAPRAAPAAPVAPAQPTSVAPEAAPASTESEPAPEPAPPAALAATEEERIPIVEEELRIGTREVVRGRSRVRSYMTEVPVQEEVELFHEETSIERRPVNRRLSEDELAAGGLLRERVIEIAEMREEPVVTKEAFVREELVVTKSVHRRVEQINDTVRRTEVETERLPPEDRPALGGLDAKDRR